MGTAREIELGKLRLGAGNALFLIAGPCVIESELHACVMAEKVAKIAADAGLPYIFKASYDKANRSEEHTSELQSRLHLVCRLLLEINKTLLSSALTSRNLVASFSDWAGVCQTA